MHALPTVFKLYCSSASIPLDAVRAEWERTSGPYHKKRLAEYYGLYRDLFHGATFVPRVPLHVAYAVGEEDLIPVYHGNEVTPAEVMLAIPFRLCVRGHTHRGITLSRLNIWLFYL